MEEEMIGEYNQVKTPNTAQLEVEVEKPAQAQGDQQSGVVAAQHNQRKIVMVIISCVAFIILLGTIIGVSVHSASSSNSESHTAAGLESSAPVKVPSGELTNPPRSSGELTNPPGSSGDLTSAPQGSTNTPQRPCILPDVDPSTVSPTAIPAYQTYGFYAVNTEGGQNYGVNYNPLGSSSSNKGWCQEGTQSEYNRNTVKTADGYLKLYTCSNQDDYGSRWAKYGEDLPTYNVFGGMKTQCRPHYYGDAEPATGWPDNTQTTCIGATGGANRAGFVPCECPDGFTEFVVSAGATDYLSTLEPCELTNVDTGRQSSTGVAEISVCLDTSQWRPGHWFGGSFSVVGEGVARNTHPHSKDGFLVIDDKTFGNPLNDDKYECPCGYQEKLIGVYCYDENCESDKMIQHYVCNLE